MTIQRVLKTTMAAAALLAALSAVPASADTRVYVRVGPPAPLVETRIAAPGPGYVWVSGYHTWNGADYVWVPGRWDRVPHAHSHWVAPRWVHDRHHGWYMVQGRWR